MMGAMEHAMVTPVMGAESFLDLETVAAIRSAVRIVKIAFQKNTAS